MDLLKFFELCMCVFLVRNFQGLYSQSSLCISPGFARGVESLESDHPVPIAEGQLLGRAVILVCVILEFEVHRLGSQEGEVDIN